MRPTANVFISSTWLDLQPERQAVEQVLAGFRETKFNGMEHFGSDGDTTRERSIAEVDRSDLYVGILGGRYGSGITHDEYRRALERRLHCLFYIKDDAAIGEDARDAEPERRDRLSAFRDEVRSRHLVRARFASPQQLATQIAIDLHRWLVDRLRPAALAIYPRLTDALHDFRPLIERETRWFVGRDALFAAVESLPTQQAAGYLRVEGDAGLGKTALAAAVAARLDAPAFFCSAAENLTRPHQCLEHLCADLILRYELPHDHLPQRAGEDSSHFGKLLAEAAQKAAAGGLPLWVVVDGLDEADDPAPGRNPLLLPATLPPNAYVLTTQRPTQATLLVQPGTSVRSIRLRAGDAMQRADLEAYLRRQGDRPEIVAACRSARPPLGPDDFVRLLADAAAGNFKYLEYVIADIVDAQPGYAPLQMAHLPAGLDRYYEQFWSRMGLDRAVAESWDDWQRLYRPVLALLAVAAEPVDAAWIAHHARCSAGEVLTRVLRPWRRFLAVDGETGGERWRVVHKSFGDFLHRRHELDIPGMHAAIADVYLADAWPASHAAYRRRHLAVHLARAGRIDALFEVIGSRAWFDAQFAADPSGTLFHDDVEAAWTAVDAIDGEPDLARELQCALTIATLRSLSSNLSPGLVAALVRNGEWAAGTALAVAREMPDIEQGLAVLSALVADTPEPATVRGALELARHLLPRQQPGRELAPFVAAFARLRCFAEADAEVDSAPNDESRAASLAAMAPHLDGEPLTVAIERAFAITIAESGRREVNARRGFGMPIGRDWHLAASRDLLRHVDPAAAPHWRERVERSALDHRARSILLGVLVSASIEAGQFEQALAWADGIAHPAERVVRLADLVDRLAPDGRLEIARDAVATALPVDDPGESRADTGVIGRLMTHLPPEERARTLDETLRRLGARNFQAGKRLAGLAPALADESEFKLAVAFMHGLRDADDREMPGRALAARAVTLLGPRAALKLATWNVDSFDRSIAIVALLPHLLEAGAVTEAFEAIERIGREPFLPQALAVAAPFLAADAVEAALAIAERLPERAAWRIATAALAERMALLGQTARALALLRAIRDGTRAFWRLHGGIGWLQARAGDGIAALASLRTIGERAWFGEALEALVPVLPAARLVDACAIAVAACNASRSENAWGEASWDSAIERALPPLWRRTAAEVGASPVLSSAAAVESPSLRASARTIGAAVLPGAERDAVQRRAVLALKENGNDRHDLVMAALADIVPDLGPVGLRVARAVIAVERRYQRRAANIGPGLRVAEVASMRRLVALEGPAAIRTARRGAARLPPQERVRLLAWIAKRAAPSVRDAIVDKALAAFDDEVFFVGRAQSLAALGPLLDDEALARALSLVPGLDEPEGRAKAMQALARRRAELAPGAGLLDWAMAAKDMATLAGALAGIASSLSGDDLDRTADAALDLPEDTWALPALEGLALRFVAEARVDDAMAFAERAGNQAAPVFTALAPHLGPAEIARARACLDAGSRIGRTAADIPFAIRRIAFGEAVEAFAFVDTIANDEERTAALRAAVAALPTDDPALLRDLWRRGLRAASDRPREQALATLVEWLPVAARLTPTARLAALSDVARTVLATWP